MNLNRKEYLSKVAGCWMGKNIGGTVGAPFEWKRQVNDITFYTQKLDGEPEPNDDLDIQLLWLLAMEREGVKLDARTLGEYWLSYVVPHWAEYGNGKINMRSGLMPPLSGSANNAFKDSCGSYIRAEIWSCVCPGAPERAVQYAVEDSAIDHGDGEGTYAEIFTAAMESAAFVENDLRKLIDIGLHYIPAECAVAGAVRLAVECYDKGVTWLEARDEMLRQYRGMGFYGHPNHVSPEDHAKGFFDGKLGFDVPSNIGIVIIGLLYGEGDFEKMMCVTVNCGEDTDCTAATAGSIYGIMNGIEGIPEKWIAPIGNSIKTITLNLADWWNVPRTIDNLTERTAKMAERVIDTFQLPVTLTDGETDLNGDLRQLLYADTSRLFENLGCVTFTFDPVDAAVDYAGNPYMTEGSPREITVYLENKSCAQCNLDVHVYADENVVIGPSAYGTVFLGTSFQDRKKAVKLTFTAEALRTAEVRAVVQLTCKGRHTAMLIPILFLNGAYNA